MSHQLLPSPRQAPCSSGPSGGATTSVVSPYTTRGQYSDAQNNGHYHHQQRATTLPDYEQLQQLHYMEQLRRSVEQLRHQTARGSPHNSSNSGSFSNSSSYSDALGSSSTQASSTCRSSTTASGTLYPHSAALATPECLVVYEPHVVVSRLEQHLYPGYRRSCSPTEISSDSSSSSGDSESDSASPIGGNRSPRRSHKDVSDILEDSGVDLGFNGKQGFLIHNNCSIQDDQKQLEHQRYKKPPPPYRKPGCSVASLAALNNNIPIENGSYDNSNMVDKSTHMHVSEFGGVCFCAVEIKKDRNMNNRTDAYSSETDKAARASRQQHRNVAMPVTNSKSRDTSRERILDPGSVSTSRNTSRERILDPRGSKPRDSSRERILDQRGIVKSRDNSRERILDSRTKYDQTSDRTNPHYRQSEVVGYRQSRGNHNSPRNTLSSNGSTHKLSLTSALTQGAKRSPTLTASVRPLHGDNVYIDMTKNSKEPLKHTAFDHRHNDISVANLSDDDDTPTGTPTPDCEIDSPRSLINTGVQTVKSALKKEQAKRREHHHQHRHHYQTQTISDSSQDAISPRRQSKYRQNEPDVEYVQSDGYSVVADTDSGYSTGSSPQKGNTPKDDLSADADNVDRQKGKSGGLHRSNSVTSLISMTDTMSVTSLEVANIMNVKEDKKSAVKLEKERLQLQHQRLESYRQDYADDSSVPPRSVWTEPQRKHTYNDDSLKKHKIYQTVLETVLPTGPRHQHQVGDVAAGSGDSGSNLQHFVTQSLQSFFTGGGKPLPQHQQSFQQFHQHYQHPHPSQQQHHHGSALWVTKGKQGSPNQHHGHSCACNSCLSKSSSSSPRHHQGAPETPVPLPSLFQLTACFRLFHVVYGDWTDLRSLRLYPTDVHLEDNSSPSSSTTGSSRSPSGCSSRSSAGSGGTRSSGSPGSRSMASTIGKGSSPSGRYTFLVISNLGNPRMELDNGGLQVGDHIIEINDLCMLNRPPEVFYSTLRKLNQVHLVIGRRRCAVSANQMASCDSSML